MAQNKTKEYKSFNFPNSLEAFEQYYYYLVEFDFIPKEMHPGTVKSIFDASARDFIEGHLEYEKFLFILEQLYYGYVMARAGLNKKMENLMTEIAYEIDHDSDSEAEVRKMVEEYWSAITSRF